MNQPQPMKTRLFLILISFNLVSFSSFAQVGNCDSLSIIDVRLSPFDINQIMVRSAYSDFDNFISYPGFSMVDDEGYILALETVNYFGMSTEQVHTLEIVNLSVEPDVPVETHLELWSFFFEELECVQTGEFLLWPLEECTTVKLTFSGFGGGPIEAAYTCEIQNQSGEIVASENVIFEGTTAPQSVTFCLEEGCNYQLNINGSLASDAGVSYALHFENYLATSAQGIIQDSVTDISHTFDIYQCLVTDVSENEQPIISAWPNPSEDMFVVEGDFPIGESIIYVVFDAMGRVFHNGIRSPGESNHFQISCTDWPNGIYFLNIQTSTGEFITQRLVCSR